MTARHRWTGPSLVTPPPLSTLAAVSWSNGKTHAYAGPLTADQCAAIFEADPSAVVHQPNDRLIMRCDCRDHLHSPHPS